MAEITNIPHKTIVPVGLDQAQLEYLAKLAVARGKNPRYSRSALIRQIIDEYRKEHEEGNDGAGKGH